MTISEYLENVGWDFGDIEATAKWGLSEYDAQFLAPESRDILVQYCYMRLIGNRDASDSLSMYELHVIKDSEERAQQWDPENEAAQRRLDEEAGK